jgi:D-tyrosyl-tRNA(Tyr) deacylase
MKAVYQRVLSASVAVEGETIASIGRGVLLLVGVEEGDTSAEAALLAEKTAHLRVFEDKAGRMNLSALDVGGSVLAVSQFTLLANTRHGRRPDFLAAARPEKARPLFDETAAALRAAGIRDVQTGRFGADMQVSLVNDGPVTILLDTADWKRKTAE